MPFNPSIDVNSWKTIQWSQDVPKLDTQLTELMLKLSTWCTNAGQVLAAPAASVADSAIASVISQRTRGYNAVGNANFDVQQIIPGWAGGAYTAGATAKQIDRWFTTSPTAPAALNLGPVSGVVPVPNSNFAVSNWAYRWTLNTQKVSLAAGDLLTYQQYVEGPQLRELINDVHSVSLLVRSSVAGLTFGCSLSSAAATFYTLTKLCTIPIANTWTLITLPSLPIWTPSATWSLVPGNIGYVFAICLAAGSTYSSPANDTWQTGNFRGATGQANFCAQTVGSTFDLAFCQHEPGNICTAPIDKPFSGANGNYQECLRYYTKSIPYAGTPGGAFAPGEVWFNAVSTTFAMGWAPHPVPMAKTPVTTTIYNSQNGTINGAQAYPAGTNITGITSPSVSEKGLGFWAATTVAGQLYRFYYVADTGW